MYAIVEIAGQQFKVEAGMEIFVNRLAAEKGHLSHTKSPHFVYLTQKQHIYC